MLAHNHQSAAAVRRQLKTVRLGLGLTRLLMDAGRTEEAQTVMASLSCAAPASGQARARAERPRCAKVSWVVQNGTPSQVFSSPTVPGRFRGPTPAARRQGPRVATFS